MKRRTLWLFYYGPLLIWMGTIFVMSTRVGGSDHSLTLLERLLGALAPKFLASLSAYQLDRLDLIARKIAHLTEYGILTLLAVRALQFGRSTPRRAAIWGALAISVLFAMTDEMHQRLVPGRTPSVRDVLIDSTGAVICMLSILLWFGAKALERWLWERYRGWAMADGAERAD